VKPSTSQMHPFIVRSASFKAKVKNLSQKAVLGELDPVRRLSKHKEILRAAGRQSRNTLLSNYQASSKATCMAHGSLSRAVMNNDKELAKLLIERLIGGADGLAIRECKVVLIDPIAFARDAEHTKRVVCARRAEKRENTPRLAKRGKAKGTTALIKLNSNIDRRLVL